MTASVTHAKVSTVPASSDPDDITTDDWNDPHDVSISAADVGADPAGTAASAVSTHEGAGDPHPTYETSAEAAAKVTTHAGASDPHGDRAFATSAVGTHESDTTSVHGFTDTANIARIAGELSGTGASPTVTSSHSGSTHAAVQAAAEATAASAASTHAAASDPHTGYQKESEKSAANGYASLSASTKVPLAELPTGTSSSTVALGDAAAGLITTHEAASDPHTGYRKESDWFLLTTFSKQGVVAVTTEGDTPPPFRFYNRIGRTLTFQMVAANATIGPSGSTSTIDVNVDGTTIMTGTKVVLPDNTGAASTVTQTTFSTTTVADGHYVSVNVDTAGGGAMQNLMVSIWVTG